MIGDGRKKLFIERALFNKTHLSLEAGFQASYWSILCIGRFTEETAQHTQTVVDFDICNRALKQEIERAQRQRPFRIVID